MDQQESNKKGFDLLAFWRNPKNDAAERANAEVITPGQFEAVATGTQVKTSTEQIVVVPEKSTQQSGSKLKTTGMNDQQIAALAEENRLKMLSNIPKSDYAKDLTGGNG